MEQKQEAVCYKHDKLEHKHFFAGFLNFADDNLKHVLLEIATRMNFGIECKKDSKSTAKNIIDELCANHLSDKTSILQKQKFLDMLVEYFPCVRFLGRPDQENDRIENFKSLVVAVDKLRHFYTHYGHNKITLEDKEVFRIIDDVQLKTVQKIKKQKKKDDKTKELLAQNLQGELEQLRKQQEDYLRSQGKNIHGVENKVWNDLFKPYIWKEKDKFDELKNQQKSKSANIISEEGLLFLLSMFLRRHEMKAMLAKITGKKATVIPLQNINSEKNNLRYMLTHWVLEFNNFRGLRRKLYSGFSKEQFVMQVADELNKIPDELYKLLTPKQQQTFLYDINTYFKDPVQNQSNDSLEVIHPVIRKRYEDKFAYFVLRYIDTFADFKKLRFQVVFGKYQKDSQIKITNNKTEVQRTINQEVSVFAKLQEVEAARKIYFAQEKSANSFLENYPAHYNLKDGKIGIKLLDTERKNSKSWEEIKDFLPENSWVKPDAFISVKDLTYLLHELLLLEKSEKNEKSNEEIIERKIIGLIKNKSVELRTEPKKTIAQLSDDEKKAFKKRLPKKLLLVGTQEQFHTQKIANALQAYIQKFADKIQYLEEKSTQAKERQKKHKGTAYILNTQEIGQEAVFMAYCIKRIMPKEIRKDLKAYNFQELQMLLAFYDKNIGTCQNMLQSLWKDYAKDEWGEYVSKAFRQNDFVAMYKTFLNGLKEKLQMLLDKQVKKIEEFPAKERKKIMLNVFRFLEKRTFTILRAEDYRKNLAEHPIMLERNCLGGSPDFWNKFTQQRPAVQSFYDAIQWDNVNWHAVPDCKNMLDNKTEKQQYRIKENWKNDVKKQKTKDVLLFELLKSAYNKTFLDTDKIDFSLPDMYQTKDEKNQNLSQAQQQAQRQKGDKSANVYRNSTFFERLVSRKVKIDKTNIYIRPDDKQGIPLKDIGKLRALAINPKVKEMAKYSPEKKEWEKGDLEEELKAYEQIRSEQILKHIHDIEKHILHHFGWQEGQEHPKCLEENGKPNFNTYLQKYNGNEAFKQYSSEDMIIKIRNNFSHNQMLPSEYFQAMRDILPYNENEHKSYSDYFCKVLIQLKEKILAKEPILV